MSLAREFSVVKHHLLDVDRFKAWAHKNVCSLTVMSVLFVIAWMLSIVELCISCGSGR